MCPVTYLCFTYEKENLLAMLTAILQSTRGNSRHKFTPLVLIFLFSVLLTEAGVSLYTRDEKRSGI